MWLYLLVWSFFLTGLLSAPVTAEEMLPAGVVNVARPNFGDRIGGGADYGLANVKPIEIAQDGMQDREIRIVRTTRDLRLSRRNEARFQVRLGQVESVYFWLEAPLVYGQWHLRILASSFDGTRIPIFEGDVQPEVINFAWSPAGSVLEFHVSSIEQTFKLSKRFLFTVSPARFSLWPKLHPIPHRTYVD